METKKEAEKLKDLLDKAEGHPMMKAIKAEEDEKVLAERLLAAGKRRELMEEGVKVIQEREADLDALIVALGKHDAKRESLLEKVNAARGALMAARVDLDREKGAAEAVLLGNYDPNIDEAIVFFREKHEGLLVKAIDTQKREGEKYINETKEMTTYTNAPGIKNALAYCRKAIAELEEMKLSSFMDAERIEELKRDIPDADALTQYDAIIKTPESNPLPRQSAFDWKLSRLLGR